MFMEKYIKMTKRWENNLVREFIIIIIIMMARPAQFLISKQIEIDKGVFSPSILCYDKREEYERNRAQTCEDNENSDDWSQTARSKLLEFQFRA
ncbi:hypothetical protein EL22_25760 [Halostagnicola sp. A56]|nr:hypothetical protein EL22_25760 [Halostagnicola sp. A56]